jgi:hypothetical protein
MSLTHSFANKRSKTILRVLGLVAVTASCGIIACGDQAPVNPPQGPQDQAGTSTTGGSSSTGGSKGSSAGSSNKGGSSNKAGSSSGGEAGASAGGDSGTAPTSGSGGASGSGNGGTSGGGASGNGGTSGGGASGGGASGNGGASSNGGASGGMGGTSGGGASGNGNGGTSGGMGGTSSGGTGGGGAGGGGTAGGGSGGGGTGGGGTAGSGGASGKCGDGIIQPPEECEPPNTANCSDDCKIVASAECSSCEADEARSACAPFALACLNSKGTMTADDQALCFDVEECIHQTNCAAGANTFTSCFCGTLTTNDCGAAPETGPDAPHGACAALIKKGMGAGATNTQVLARMTSRSYAAGAGINRYNCMKNNDVCRPLCGF